MKNQRKPFTKKATYGLQLRKDCSSALSGINTPKGSVVNTIIMKNLELKIYTAKKVSPIFETYLKKENLFADYSIDCNDLLKSPEKVIGYIESYLLKKELITDINQGGYASVSFELDKNSDFAKNNFQLGVEKITVELSVFFLETFHGRQNPECEIKAHYEDFTISLKESGKCKVFIPKDNVKVSYTEIARVLEVSSEDVERIMSNNSKSYLEVDEARYLYHPDFHDDPKSLTISSDGVFQTV